MRKDKLVFFKNIEGGFSLYYKDIKPGVRKYFLFNEKNELNSSFLGR